MKTNEHLFNSLIVIGALMLFSNFNCKKDISAKFNELAGLTWNYDGYYNFIFSTDNETLKDDKGTQQIGTFTITRTPLLDPNDIGQEDYNFNGNYVDVEFDVTVSAPNDLYFLFNGHYEGRLQKLATGQKAIKGTRTRGNYPNQIVSDFLALSN